MTERELKIQSIDKRIDDLESHAKMWAESGRSMSISHGGAMAMRAHGELSALMNERKIVIEEIEAEEYDQKHNTHRLEILLLRRVLSSFEEDLKEASFIKKIKIKKEIKLVLEKISILEEMDNQNTLRLKK